MSHSIRLGLVALLLGAALLVAACGGAPKAPVATPTPAPATGSAFVYSPPVLGKAEAPVTIIEYGDYQ